MASPILPQSSVDISLEFFLYSYTNKQIQSPVASVFARRETSILQFINFLQ